MNILMINGTMRKSTTYRIAKMFVERVTLSRDTVNELFLPRDMPEFCRGCGLCITQGAKKCPDYFIYLRRVTRLIDEADLLVFATPAYVYHATGQIKALLDHYGYRWMVHRPEGSMFRKQAVCFSTAAGGGMKSALKDITDSLNWWGVGRIYTYGVAVRSMSWDGVEKSVKDKIDKKVNEIMSRIVHEPGKVTPSLRARVLFYLMRHMHRRRFMQQIDTDYWKEMGWLGDVRPWMVEKAEPERIEPGKAGSGQAVSEKWPKKANVCIKKLTPEMVDDFLYYFDNDAFSDHEEWSACYCLQSHLGREEDERCVIKEERRQRAKELVLQGIMTGYLIYDGNKVAGWCNAGDKIDYGPVCEDVQFFTDRVERGRIKVLYCMDIAPAYRGKGIAKAVMERVLEDAKEEGYSYVEGYPFSDTERDYQYRGPVRLYEKYGFELYRKQEWFFIMRKEIRRSV